MFTIWKITFFCHPAKNHFARIDFSSNAQHPEYILGTNKDAKNIKIYERIETFCGVLENCLMKWDDYIQEKRQKTNFINFFTTRQLVLLQREIAKTFSERNENIALELSQLLSLVHPSCTKKELSLAATNARQRLLKSDDGISDKIPINSSSEEDSVSAFVKDLQNRGFPLSLAKAAEENVVSGSIAKGLIGIMDLFTYYLMKNGYNQNCKILFWTFNVLSGILWCMANKNRFEQHQGQVEQSIETKEELFHDFLKGEIKSLRSSERSALQR